MRTLVVATDFSSGAELAVERAARIARNRGAALWLLHVFDDGVWASMRSLYDIERWVGADPLFRRASTCRGRRLVCRVVSA
ncbi:MAG: universal stress protein [Rhodocyclales bacterium]|nr:universal stress protein [Rhodocyclales bacterium]